MTTAPTELVGVRYFIDDVRAVADFCTTHLVVDDLEVKIDRLSTAGLSLRSDPASGLSGHRSLLTDAAGDLIELFHHAPCPTYRRQHIAC